MDAKDAIIFQQLDVIRQMSENNLRRVGADLWGHPAPKPREEEKSLQQGPAPDQNEEKAEQETPPPEPIEDLKKELEGYIGLERVKKEVQQLIDLTQVYNLRKANNLPSPDLSLHMVFSGNPGTGKTMIARLMARVYHSLGILSKGHLVEVDRSGLVAGYVGQTAIKTQEVIQKAMGGVLFIDEAYALTQNRGLNDFGQEAVDTLLKAMEDHRDDLIVIVAGYDELMKGFISSNPGLQSRFNRYLHFEDYTLDEMEKIFEMQAKKGCYTISAQTLQAVRKRLENAGPGFGNARGVRNLFERVLVSQAVRLAATENPGRDQLMEITPEDVEKAADETA